MKGRKWNRAAVVGEIRKDIWRHLTQSARREEDLVLEAQALFDMSTGDVRRLGIVQFLLSAELRAFLDGLPGLSRRLATTTARHEEWSAERVRGPINWNTTFGARAATGLPHLYVTSPARRAFQTPENELLVAALDAVREAGTRSGWSRSTSPEVGDTVRSVVAEVERWARMRTLVDVERQPITPQKIARVRTGRHRKRYQPVLDLWDLYQSYVRRLDRQTLRRAIERHALVVAADDRLLELLCAFQLERSLCELGWTVSKPGLLEGGRFLSARGNGVVLDVYYQQTPSDLARHSIYASVQAAHRFDNIGALRPDFVLRARTAGGLARWLLFEVKGVQRDVAESARAAIRDLLGYRRAFDRVLNQQPILYGVGVAWGSELAATAEAEIAVCSPDMLPAAMSLLVGTPETVTELLRL